MTIAIIDDNFEDYQELKNIVIKYFTCTFMDLIPNIYYYQDEAKFLTEFIPNTFDFIFIDYYLNTLTGLEISRRIRSKDNNVNLIFTTVSPDYAIESYKVKASGYLVKPIIFDDLREIMELVDYKQIHDRRYIEFDIKGKKFKILLNDIIYCDINGHYMQIHTKNSHIEKCRITFTDFQKILSPYPEFLLCYRGCIVNMKHIKKVGNLTFIMSNGEYIPFRKKCKSEIQKCYSEFLMEAVREGWL